MRIPKKNIRDPTQHKAAQRYWDFPTKTSMQVQNIVPIRSQCFSRPIAILQVKLLVNSKACYMVLGGGPFPKFPRFFVWKASLSWLTTFSWMGPAYVGEHQMLSASTGRAHLQSHLKYISVNKIFKIILSSIQIFVPNLKLTSKK